MAGRPIFRTSGPGSGGASLGRDRAKWESFIRPLRLPGCHDEVAWPFGVVFANCGGKPRSSGATTYGIAAAALANGQTVLTRNRDAFLRAPGLEVFSY